MSRSTPAAAWRFGLKPRDVQIEKRPRGASRRNGDGRCRAPDEHRGILRREGQSHACTGRLLFIVAHRTSGEIRQDPLVETLRSAAAAHWGTKVEDISWTGGNAFSKRRKSNLALTDLARLSSDTIKTFGHYKGRESSTYSFQALVADVAVDAESGQVQVTGLHFVYDVTTVINPLIHQGQLEGAIIQGLGYALCEEMGIEEGRVMVSSLGDYKIFCVRDVPPLVTSFVMSTVGPGPFSAKAVGEAGISIVAPAIANAIHDATGVRITELPITAEKLFKQLTTRGFRTRAKLKINC